MAEQQDIAGKQPNSDKKQDTTMDLRPTLFIGVGGTGMEVLMRVRRRILNTPWGGAGNRTRVESLSDFPIAQFIQFDLDQGALVESGKAQSDDLQFELVKFTDDEKLVEHIDMEKYMRDDDALEKYPHIKEWTPLTPRKLRELGIDPSKGAGQVRSLSRLYFFDKYAKIRDKVRFKLKTLRAGLTSERKMTELGLKMEAGRFRIVVVGSVAGGTGSGSFLDMGLLARWLARTEVDNADVELVLFLPTGYSGANKDRTEANAYAALMELESAMRGNKGYVGSWDPYDQPELPSEPYTEVYLVDTGNVAQQHTKDINDVYHMVANALFEDFSSADFARRKRSVAVNQAQHKTFLYDALVPKNRFPDMRLSYSKRYSAFGHASIDTQQEAFRDERAHRWAGEMLKAFFGVGGLDIGANRATDKMRDEFMQTHMFLKSQPFSDLPEFSDKNIQLTRSSGEFNDYFLVEELLQDKQGMLLAGVEQRVNQRLDDIRSGFGAAEWSTQLREAVKQLERDAVRDQDSTADTTEDRISKRRRELLEQIKTTVKHQLYAYLDNKEYGGLEYVLSLVEQIKDAIEAGSGGLLQALSVNADRYREIKEAVRSREIERLMGNLEQTKGGFLGNFMGSGEKQATLIMDQLRIEIANGIKFHLRAKAADDANALLKDLSDWLGRKQGVDAKGYAIWTGLVGEFQEGRAGVHSMLEQLAHTNAILQKELTKEHATLIQLNVQDQEIPIPTALRLRDWADEAFKDLGGSKKVFPMLTDPEQRTRLLSKVKQIADRQISQLNLSGPDQELTDPLFTELEGLSAAVRMDLFRRLISCAMPWVDASLSGDFNLRADQYKCFIGVANAEAFKRRFRAEIEASAPTQAGITAAQVSIVETGKPGRMVCYCELSGIPTTVLRGIEGWRTSYRREFDKMPPHTHLDSTQFSHPIAPNPEEINRLAEDFKVFLWGIMLGVLTRSTQRLSPPGQYQFAVARGDTRRIGNERAMRQNGLPANYRQSIIERVNNRIAELDRHALVALAALSDFYKNSVYTPKLVSDATGAEQTRIGFACAIAKEGHIELSNRAERTGMTERDIDQLTDRLQQKLKHWAQPISESDEDAFEWEVRQPDEDSSPRLKYAFKPESLEPGALASMLTAQSVTPSITPITSAIGVSMPPPLSINAHQYYLGIADQQHGPYTREQLIQMLGTQQINPSMTKVWREGMTGWLAIKECLELQSLFITPPVLSVPPPMSP